MPEPLEQGVTHCHFFHFGLIVTGTGEREHLPKLFQPLMATGVCHFRVEAQVGQRGPITSQKRLLTMVGRGKRIPDRDAEQIGLPARRFLARDKCNFLLLIDDLEHGRRECKTEVFERYRTALDTILNEEQRGRAAVFFLVNMLEAYYFAHADAVNQHLELEPPLQDYEGDVETIHHPKAELKRLHPGYSERDDGGAILARLDTEHVLSRPDTCANLRTLFAWCVGVLRKYPHFESADIAEKFHLDDGIKSDTTQAQINAL